MIGEITLYKGNVTSWWQRPDCGEPCQQPESVRMDFPFVVPRVSAAAHAMSAALSKLQGGKPRSD